jgi:hypothetical protein
MKTFITIVVALVLFTSPAWAAKPGEAIIIGHSKNKNLFVFKTEKKFIGATIEIYTSGGELLTSQNLQKRKMIIDFEPLMKDTYTIRVVKGDAMREYQFVKK